MTSEPVGLKVNFAVPLPVVRWRDNRVIEVGTDTKILSFVFLKSHIMDKSIIATSHSWSLVSVTQTFNDRQVRC